MKFNMKRLEKIKKVNLLLREKNIKIVDGSITLIDEDKIMTTLYVDERGY